MMARIIIQRERGNEMGTVARALALMALATWLIDAIVPVKAAATTRQDNT